MKRQQQFDLMYFFGEGMKRKKGRVSWLIMGCETA
jgi:hypothetical protein